MTLSVSVVLPTHDRPESLQKAVQSILAQSRPALELIVVNDGADQIDPAIAEKAAAAGLRFTCLRQDFASSTASRNRGMSAARGDIVLLVDDDIVLPVDCLAHLTELYEADSEGLVAGIGGVYIEPRPMSIGRRIGEALAVLLGRTCWMPRVIAARYLALPPALRRKLVPARKLAAGALSLRRAVAARQRFQEAFGGYALSEDREFTFRVGRIHPLFLAPSLKVLHNRIPGGRPDMRRLGRIYVANSLYIARHSVDGGAGTCLLVGYDFAGTMLLYTIWGLGRLRRGNIEYAVGMAAELWAQGLNAVKRIICGS